MDFGVTSQWWGRVLPGVNPPPSRDLADQAEPNGESCRLSSVHEQFALCATEDQHNR